MFPLLVFEISTFEALGGAFSAILLYLSILLADLSSANPKTNPDCRSFWVDALIRSATRSQALAWLTTDGLE